MEIPPGMKSLASGLKVKKIQLFSPIQTLQCYISTENILDGIGLTQNNTAITSLEKLVDLESWRDIVLFCSFFFSLNKIFFTCSVTPGNFTRIR